MDAFSYILTAGLTVVLQADPHIDIAGGADGGVDWVMLLAGLAGTAVLGALAVGGYVLLNKFRRRVASSAQKVAPVPMISQETRRRVQKAVQAGEYEAAGDLLARAGAHDDASEAYVDAGAFVKGARSFQATGNRAQAIHYYKLAGQYEQAAALYAKEGEYRAAAAEYLQAGDHRAAAAQYEKAADYRRAAQNYERVDDLVGAARNFARADQPLEAARCYQLYLEEGGDDADNADIARTAGRLFRRADQPQQAAGVYRAAGLLEEAAACLREAGDFQQAADLLMDIGEPMRAAEVLEGAGHQQRAAKMRAEAAIRDGRRQEAADMFAAAGHPERAAQLFADLDQPGRAAPLFEEVEHYDRAASLYESAGNYGLAAHCAEVGGQLAYAAELYHQAGDVDSEITLLRRQGDYFRAGRLLFEHRRYQDGLSVLSEIDSTEPIYARSLELAGDIYQAQGRFEKAYSRFRSALGEREPSDATLPVYYKMARALEEEHDLTGALDHYNAIVGVDADFEDATARLSGLRKRLRRGSMAGQANNGMVGADADGDQELSRRYEVIEEVARGGMGIVYRARDTVLGRVVAFKILGKNLRDNETAVKYFLREARAAAALSHSNIVTIYDAGEQDGEYYMAMEFVEGTTLKDLVKREGALDGQKVRYVLVNCCRALHYAHSKGVIHRDIKSGNVMLTRDKKLKIMDFGLAKFLREYQNNHTQQVGTPFYMSPEQIIGKDIDFRSDLYSLGCTVFECMTGQVPFYKGDLSYHHLHTRPPTPSSINPAVGDEMERVVLKLLTKSPDQRYQSARQILEELDEG